MLKTNKPIVFLFSGQGTQYFQMGRELYENNERFHHWMDVVDQLVTAITGKSIIAQIYNPTRKRGEPFNQIRCTSPAIFMVSYSLAQVLMEAGIRPDFLMGASMGEQIAACIGGALRLEDCIDILIRQADLFEARCGNGGMLAVLAPVELYHSTALFHEHTTLASINYHSCFVVSGQNEPLSEVIGFLKERKICHSLLPVSQAFHSKQIDSVKTSYLDLVGKMRFHPPEIPLISCLTNGRIFAVHGGHFWDCIRGPMNIQQTIQCLEKDGAHIYIDLSSSGTFANFAKYNLSTDSHSEVFAAINPFGGKTVIFEKSGTLKPEASHLRSFIDAGPR